MISYSHRDEELQGALTSALVACGVEVEVAPKFIAGGDRFPEKIAEVIAKVDHVIVLFTPAAKSSPWVRAEFDEAASLQRKTGRPAKVVPLAVGYPWPRRGSIPAWASDLHFIRIRATTGSLGGSWLSELLAILGATAPEPVLLAQCTRMNSALRHWFVRRTAWTLAMALGGLTLAALMLSAVWSWTLGEAARDEARVATRRASESHGREDSSDAIGDQLEAVCSDLKAAGSWRTAAELDGFKELYRACLKDPGPTCADGLQEAALIVDNAARCESCPWLLRGSLCGEHC